MPNRLMQNSVSHMNLQYDIAPTKAANIYSVLKKISFNPSALKQQVMTIKLQIRPNVFYSSIVVEARCEQNMHSIVRISDKGGRIVKMFGWYLLAGANITTIHDLEPGLLHDYQVTISDNQGKVIFEAPLIHEA